jgi:hypothetical protein
MRRPPKLCSLLLLLLPRLQGFLWECCPPNPRRTLSHVVRFIAPKTLRHHGAASLCAGPPPPPPECVKEGERCLNSARCCDPAGECLGVPCAPPQEDGTQNEVDRDCTPICVGVSPPTKQKWELCTCECPLKNLRGRPRERAWLVGGLERFLG